MSYSKLEKLKILQDLAVEKEIKYLHLARILSKKIKSLSPLAIVRQLYSGNMNELTIDKAIEELLNYFSSARESLQSINMIEGSETDRVSKETIEKIRAFQASYNLTDEKITRLMARYLGFATKKRVKIGRLTKQMNGLRLKKETAIVIKMALEDYFTIKSEDALK